MAARRIGITPGSGDYVGAADTDAEDETGNTISGQVMLIMNEGGEIMDFAKARDKDRALQLEILDVLKEIRDLLQEK